MVRFIGAVTVQADLEKLSTDELTGEIARCREVLAGALGRRFNSHQRNYYESRVHNLEKLVRRRME